MLPETHEIIVTSNSLIEVVKSNIKVGYRVYVRGCLYTKNIDHSTMTKGKLVKIILSKYNVAKLRVIEREGILVSKKKIITKFPEEAFTILLCEYFNLRLKRLQHRDTA